MKHDIWIEVKTEQASRVLVKLFKQHINVSEVIYIEKGLRFKINIEDQKKLKKIVGYRFRKIHESGLFHILEVLKKRWLIALGILLFCFFTFLFSHIIVKVEVIHSNKEIRSLVEKALDQHGIHKLTWKKDFKTLSNIKEDILKEHPNELEWIEIETHGMKYIVRIEERIITPKEEEKPRCHLVATKSAIVKKIMFSKGEAKVSVNDFVKEGDILVSGELLKEQEMKETLCATGNVYGEVWYTSKITLPVTAEEEIETGKSRINFRFEKGSNTGYILRPRLENYKDEKKHLFTIFDTDFYYIKQKEVIPKTREYTEEELIKHALELTEEKIKLTLQEGEEIQSKKVLKKQRNDSTMEIEVFVSVIENISRQEEFQEKKEG